MTKFNAIVLAAALVAISSPALAQNGLKAGAFASVVTENASESGGATSFKVRPSVDRTPDRSALAIDPLQRKYGSFGSITRIDANETGGKFAGMQRAPSSFSGPTFDPVYDKVGAFGSKVPTQEMDTGLTRTTRF